MDTPLVVLDVETTGLKPENGDEVIEVAAQKFLRDEVLDEFHSLIVPSRPINHEQVTRFNGITQAMLEAEGKEAGDVFPALVEFLGMHTLVGHNIAFDLGFINAHLGRLGLPTLTNQRIDTRDVARRLLIIPSYSLERVAAYLKVPQPEAHRALADVVTTRQVLVKLFDRAKGA